MHSIPHRSVSDALCPSPTRLLIPRSCFAFYVLTDFLTQMLTHSFTTHHSILAEQHVEAAFVRLKLRQKKVLSAGNQNPFIWVPETIDGALSTTGLVLMMIFPR